MSIDQLINKIASDTDIHFHDFVQDNDTIIAKSHFFDIHFGPTYIEVTQDYPLPGNNLKNLFLENLPFRIDYIVDNYYIILVEFLDELYSKCIGAEQNDEDDYEL
jgi:hypothetical protein